MLSAPPVIGISINRDRSDFSERERALLEVLRPHLTRAHRSWSAVKALSTAVDSGGQAAILLNRSGVLLLATDQAQRWLREYFGESGSWNGDLPEPVMNWLQQQCAHRDVEDGVPAPVGPLIARRPDDATGDRLLELHFAAAGITRDHDLVLLRETIHDHALHVLSRREFEVLRQAAEGLTDAEIADALYMSRRTVNGHLQRVYRKLGVTNRTAAIARVPALRSAL